MSGRDVDPSGETLAAASAGAEAAARTLTEAGVTRPREKPDGDLIGKHLAHFRIERRLGQGGMGEVFLATDLALDRPVAVKVLGHEIGADPAFRDRFVREARAQARVLHPNICHIYFIGEQDGRLFFAMEYVDGENLQTRLARVGKLAHPDALELIRQTAAGLAEAQKHGFIHRDIKPSNLLVDRNGVVKVADFGLVKEVAQGEAADTGAAVVGTPLYMAPEQARGDAVDFRTDIYALGVTLHHLVAGSPPFSGATPLAVVSRHLTETRPRLGEAARGAVLVDALCDRMMAKRPADRFASYEELTQALEQASPRLTRPAGGWARAFALAFDAAIAALLTLPFSMAGEALGLVDGGDLLPAVAAAYFIIANARFGRTYGKRALEIQITADGRAGGIGWRRALVRWAAQWGPLYVLGVGTIFVRPHVPGSTAALVATVAMWVLGVGPLVVAGLLVERSAAKRTYWDRVSGTRVVYQRT